MTGAQSGLLPVGYGRPGNDHPFQRMVVASLSFNAAIETIRAAILEADLWIIHEIDPQMLLKRGGYAIRGTRQLLFFHPRYMVRLLSADPSALLEAPLKIVVMEEMDGVMVRWLAPETVFGRYGNAGLVELGREFQSIYADIIARLEHFPAKACPGT
jgi:uncharacterized protein (DUF302 family)